MAKLEVGEAVEIIGGLFKFVDPAQLRIALGMIVESDSFWNSMIPMCVDRVGNVGEEVFEECKPGFERDVERMSARAKKKEGS